MTKPYSARRVTRLDASFGGALMAVSLALAINVAVQSIHLIYVVILLALVGLALATKIHSMGDGALQDLWVLAGLSLPLYFPVDYLFESELGLVTYLTNDPRILVTPVYVPLYWVLGVLLFGYTYRRVKGLTNRPWTGALATGLFSAASTTLAENLFNAMGFYRNAPNGWMIGSIPLYVPLGYFTALLPISFYLRHKYMCGCLLYGFVGLCWYIFYRIVP